MVRQWRALIALAEDPGLVSNTQWLTGMRNLVPVDLTLSFGHHGHQAYMWCTYIHAGKALIFNQPINVEIKNCLPNDYKRPQRTFIP